VQLCPCPSDSMRYSSPLAGARSKPSRAKKASAASTSEQGRIATICSRVMYPPLPTAAASE
jgi:hypothetical protein